MRIKTLFSYWAGRAFSPGTVLKKKYEAFQSLLSHDKRAHELMADLEEIYHGRHQVDFSVVEKKYGALSRCVSEIVENLQQMVPGRYRDLEAYYKKFDFYVRFLLSPKADETGPPFTLAMGNIDDRTRILVGGKAANLSILERALELPIPAGFVVTTRAFNHFIQYNGLRPVIDKALSAIDIRNTAGLNRIAEALTASILNARIPPEIESEILDRFRDTAWHTAESLRVAVRSSATGEDGRTSFAGQYRSELGVDEANIMDAYRLVIASKYSPEALFYRINWGMTDAETPMAVMVLEMIDAAASGVVYTEDPEDTDTRRLAVHSIFGLGELLVQGEVTPDRYRIEKGTTPRIIARDAGTQPRLLTTGETGRVRKEAVEEEKQTHLSLDDASVLTLADWGRRVESHTETPQDMEWCLSKDGSLFMLQSRPLGTVRSDTAPPVCEIPDAVDRILLSGGNRAASGVGWGKVFQVRRESDLDRIPDNSVLVVRHAASRYVKILHRIRAVVAETGSVAGHFASVAREFGVPAIVNMKGATGLLKNGRVVTVHADEKTIYDGLVQEVVESPCARPNLMEDSPFMRRLEYVMGFVSPLRLLDPAHGNFTPHGCRSLHDIIRFAHEKSVQEMFTIGNRRTGRKMGARKLVSPLPMLIYLLDVGNGLSTAAASKKKVTPEEIKSRPMRAVWQGLNHPDIQWSRFSHFNWEEYDRIVMSGGIISADSAMFASYGVLSEDYLNLNLKFGYHFVILDTICGGAEEKNHILFRFAGGGGNDTGRSLRAEFLLAVLERLDLWVERKSDLVDARLDGAPMTVMEEKLDQIGRLLGATRLMDMYLKEPEQVAGFAEDFLAGRYHFASVEMDE